MQLPFDLSLLTLLAYPHSSFDRNLLYRYLELSGVPLKVTGDPPKITYDRMPEAQ